MIHAEHAESKPSHANGLLAALRALLRGRGSGASPCGSGASSRAGAGLPSPARSPRRFALALCPVLVLASLQFASAPAQAEVTHEYLPGPSKEISKSIPPEEPHKEPEERLSGPLFEPLHMTFDSGDLWIDESTEQFQSRIDKYDASSGAFTRRYPSRNSHRNRNSDIWWTVSGSATPPAKPSCTPPGTPIPRSANPMELWPCSAR